MTIAGSRSDNLVGRSAPPLEAWPKYEFAVRGLRDYWYPVMFSRHLRGRMRSINIVGERLVLLRDRGRAYALYDRCPHRGIPLRFARRECPGTITCVYHGWTFDVTDGRLVVALTDGPDSPIVGKVQIPTYPVEERKGIIWVWLGDGAPVPLEEDVPPEFLRDDAEIDGWFRVRPGNWRYAAENGFDEAHAKYLHRTAWMLTFRHLPAWTTTNIVPLEDGHWITKKQAAVVLEDDYPVIGNWPRRRWWKRPNTSRYFKAVTPAGTGTSLRLPGTLRVASFPAANVSHYEWYVPVDDDNHLYVQFLVRWTRNPLQRLLHHLQYRLFYKWLFHLQFNGQDASMVEWVTRDDGPERLFRPDKSVTAWRRMVEQSKRGVPVPSPGPPPVLARAERTSSRMSSLISGETPAALDLALTDEERE
jgi:phenylpropionate dioxygenase-like ring-hydroxylating dioxygenase large terminal subunit